MNSIFNKLPFVGTIAILFVVPGLVCALQNTASTGFNNGEIPSNAVEITCMESVDIDDRDADATIWEWQEGDKTITCTRYHSPDGKRVTGWEGYFEQREERSGNEQAGSSLVVISYFDTEGRLVMVNEGYAQMVNRKDKHIATREYLDAEGQLACGEGGWARYIIFHDPKSGTITESRSYEPDGKLMNIDGVAVTKMTSWKTDEGTHTVYEYEDADGNPAILAGIVPRFVEIKDEEGNWVWATFTNWDGSLWELNIIGHGPCTIWVEYGRAKLLDSMGNVVTDWLVDDLSFLFR